jgi:predicted RNA-binding Zn ribbon-like protein
VRSDRFPRLGGHAALDFVNTKPVLRGEPVELLGSFEDLADWTLGAELTDEEDAAAARALRPSQAEGDAAAGRARELREALREGLEALRDGRPAPAGLVRAVNETLARRVVHDEVAGRGRALRLVRRFRPECADDLLIPVAGAVADLLCNVDPATLRRCGNPACVLWFADARGRRRWCSMAVCGNRMKVAAFQRRAARPGRAGARRRRES